MDQSGHSREKEVTHTHDLRSSESSQHNTEKGAQENELASATTTAPPANTKPVVVPVRTSARVLKKVKLDLEATVAQSKASKKEEDSNDTKQTPTANPEAKRRRNWGLWTMEDKNIFFEALNECGKDFDAIQAHVAMKMKKKGSTEAKTKDQVRHFYYRSWHKVSKFITFSVELQKVTQELYALINFGELRKRLGRSVLDKNTIVKLHELIYHGYTLIKIRGKTVRVRTPLCRALRKLNKLDKDNEELPKLPPQVVVELHPLNNETWTSVHATAQNPRARTSLPLQCRLSTLITFLQQRWQKRDSKLLDKILASGEVPHVPPPQQEVRLRLVPLAGARISFPTVSFNENLTSTSLSLQTYEERFLSNPGAEQPTGFTSKGRSTCAKGRGKKKESEAKKQAAKEQQHPPNPEPPPESDDKLRTEQCSGKFVQNILSLQLEGDDATDGDLASFIPVGDFEGIIKQEKEVKKVETKLSDEEEYVERIKSGWTLENSRNVTMGELYIMFGEDGKVVLDYSWETVPEATPKPSQSQLNQITQNEAESAMVSPKKSESVLKLLSRLVSLAKLLPVVKDKPSCPCGHICGKNNRGHSTGRQRSSKVSKAAHASAAAATAATATTTVQIDPSKMVAQGAVVQATTVLVPNTLELPPGTTMAFQPTPASGSAFANHKIIHQPIQDGVFRRPLLAPSQFKTQSGTTPEEAFKAQLDQFRPKYCNRRGRSGRKNVVVQRMLPLLPKSKYASSMVLKVLPQPGDFRPIGSKGTNARVLSFTPMPINSAPSLVLPVIQQQPQPVAVTPQPVTVTPQPGPAVIKRQKTQQVIYTPEDIVTSHTSSEAQAATESSPLLSTRCVEPNAMVSSVSPPSPPSISSLLGLGSEELSLGADSTTLLDVPLANHGPNFAGNMNFSGLLGNGDHALDDSAPDPCNLLQSGATTPPISPTRILKESDNQWLNSEVVDFSLSSFLSHLESPLKNSSNTSMVPASDIVQDLEAHMNYMLHENSSECVIKFADLASQIASDSAVKE